MPLKDIIQYQTLSADPIVVGDTRVTPQTQTLSIRFPFGGMVWNRPAAVLVERDDVTQRIPILDVTRVAQVVAGVIARALKHRRFSQYSFSFVPGAA